jgi:molecular chaperone Hsp33
MKSISMLMSLAVASCQLRALNAFSPPALLHLSRLHQRLHSEAKSDGSSSASAATTSTALAEYGNKNNLNDQVFSAMSKAGGIKVTVATIRNLLNDAMIMHTLTATSADALGRLLACSLLLSNGMQLEQTLQLTLNSDGPLRGVMALSTGSGRVKGYVGSPQIGDMSLSEAIGKGALQVVKNHPNWTNPYNGITAIRHGDVDRDVGLYLAESEQKACALAAATTFNGILCTSAGGYLIEQLPGVTEEEIRQVQDNLDVLVKLDGGDKLPTNLLLKGMTPVEIAEIILKDLEIQPLQQISPAFACDCTDDRLVRALRLLPREDIEDLLLKEEQLEARCQFCGKVYRMGPEQVKERLEQAKGDPSRDDNV